ncbi:MAG: hypothetical protein ABEJ03_03990 [Candidatus Nanohaloarchaea archaeon]
MHNIPDFESYLKDTEFQKKRQDLHRKRRELAEKKILPLIRDFRNEEISLSKFKSSIDGVNKQNNYWGFTGLSGMMFFNEISRFSQMEEEIRESIQPPKNLDEASRIINDFSQKVSNLDPEGVEDAKRTPLAKSTVFFLSYFWALQEPKRFPMAHKSARRILNKHTDFEEEQNNHGELYKEFNKKLDQLIEKYNIEVNWSYEKVNGILYKIDDEEKKEEKEEAEKAVEKDDKGYREYIPPIVEDFPKIARGEKEMKRKYDVNLPLLMEQKAVKIFELLGFAVDDELGQGSGREPDGLAINLREGLAIMWDTKKRENGGYSVGSSEERKIREYIDSYKRTLKQDYGIERVYYVLISSGFSSTDFDTDIRDKNPLIGNLNFIDAQTLIEILGFKIKYPKVTASDLEEIFQASSKIDREQIAEAKPEEIEII